MKFFLKLKQSHILQWFEEFFLPKNRSYDILINIIGSVYDGETKEKIF